MYLECLANYFSRLPRAVPTTRQKICQGKAIQLKKRQTVLSVATKGHQALKLRECVKEQIISVASADEFPVSSREEVLGFHDKGRSSKISEMLQVLRYPLSKVCTSEAECHISLPSP